MTATSSTTGQCRVRSYSGDPEGSIDRDLITEVYSLLIDFPLLVESRCGAVAVDAVYLFPPLSFGGASITDS